MSEPLRNTNAEGVGLPTSEGWLDDDDKVFPIILIPGVVGIVLMLSGNWKLTLGYALFSFAKHLCASLCSHSPRSLWASLVATSDSLLSAWAAGPNQLNKFIRLQGNQPRTMIAAMRHDPRFATAITFGLGAGVNEIQFLNVLHFAMEGERFRDHVG